MRIAILALAAAAAVLSTAWGQHPPRLPPVDSREAVDDSTPNTMQVPAAKARQPLEAPPTTTEVLAQVARLERAADKAAQLGAIEWLKKHAHVGDAVQAVPVLEQCVRSSESRAHDPETRSAALIALALIANAHRQPCPLSIVEALLDKQEDVRWQAVHCIGLFRTFPRGSLELLLRSVQSEHAEVRDASVWALVGAGGQDRQAVAAIEKAKDDREFQVRHNAHVAAFRATGDLEPYLRYRIRLAEDPDGVLNPLPQDPEARERDQTIRNLATLGQVSGMDEWSGARADELAPLLMRLLEDKSPLMRRGAAREMGAGAIKVPGTSWAELLLPYVEQDGAASPKKAAKSARPRPTKLAFALEKLKAADRLQRLAVDDPDETVRGAAATALARLESVLGQKP